MRMEVANTLCLYECSIRVPYETHGLYTEYKTTNVN